jgi:hypothetical protein
MNRIGRVGYAASVEALRATVTCKHVNTTRSAASTARVFMSRPRLLDGSEDRTLADTESTVEIG